MNAAPCLQYRRLRRPTRGNYLRSAWQTRIELNGVLGRMSDFTVTPSGELIRRPS